MKGSEENMTKIKCCLGCKVHHLPELKMEMIIGKCTCPCHKDNGWHPEIERVVLDEE